MISSRHPIRWPIATLAFALLAAPAAGQNTTSAFALTGMTNAALWTSAAPVSPSALSPARASVAPTPESGLPTHRRFVAGAPVVVAESAARSTVTAPQAQDGGGGFPWLEVGIGAAVGALFLQAVATANSGDAAELPLGGVSVVLPSS